jgi:hypothetical protein
MGLMQVEDEFGPERIALATKSIYGYLAFENVRKLRWKSNFL